MTEQTQWYDAMSKALRKRDHAVRMISRWTTELAVAEADVQKLSSSAPEQQQVPEQVTDRDTVVQ